MNFGPSQATAPALRVSIRVFCRPILIVISFLAAAGQLRAQDTVFLKNGRNAPCRVLEFTVDSLKISYLPTPGAAAEERLVPLAELDYVELAPLPGETEALSLAVREGRADPLITFWAKRVPWLGRPRTNGGEIGLTYAELLTRVSTTDRMERALKIYQQIESADWSAERRGRAQAGRLRIMLRQGRTAEVRPLAEALLEKSGDSRVLIELQHVIAEASAAGLTQLEKDHPRWQEENDIIPRHTQLLNEAMDGYLFPHLFHGAEEDLAARGLWAAAQLADAQKDLPQAAGWCTDLTNLYATTPEADAAQAWLKKQPAPVLRTPPLVGDEAGDEPAEEASEEEPESAPAKSKIKTKPKSKTKKTAVPEPEAADADE